MTQRPADPTDSAIDYPAYWLVCLERAVSAGDYPAAVEAQHQLRRLGIEATLRVIPFRGREVAHA